MQIDDVIYQLIFAPVTLIYIFILTSQCHVTWLRNFYPHQHMQSRYMTSHWVHSQRWRLMLKKAKLCSHDDELGWGHSAFKDIDNHLEGSDSYAKLPTYLPLGKWNAKYFSLKHVNISKVWIEGVDVKYHLFDFQKSTAPASE